MLKNLLNYFKFLDLSAIFQIAAKSDNAVVKHALNQLEVAVKLIHYEEISKKKKEISKTLEEQEEIIKKLKYEIEILKGMVEKQKKDRFDDYRKINPWRDSYKDKWENTRKAIWNKWEGNPYSESYSEPNSSYNTTRIRKIG